MVTHPWIEKSIKDVNEEVHQNEAESKDHHTRLDHGIIPREDGVDDEPSEARPFEYRFDKDRSAEKIAELKARDSDRGDEGIPEGMMDINSELGLAFGPCHLDIILPKNLQHT